MRKNRMSMLGKLMVFFPALVIMLWLLAFYYFVSAPSIGSLLGLGFALYGVPLLCYRCHALIWPLEEGVSPLVGADYSPWYGTHQIQLVYIAFPVLEATLRLIPGLFSFWLRLWGSKVGRAVYWTPTLELLDRGLLDISDGAVFGHRCGLSAHIITPKKGNLLLLVEKVQIGRGSFVGAGCFVGPGAVIDDGAMVPAGHNVRPKQRVSRPVEQA